MAKHPPTKQSFVFDNNRNMFQRSWGIYTSGGLVEAPKIYLRSANNVAVELFCYEVQIEQDCNKLAGYLNLIHQTGVSYYRFVTSEGKEIRFTIDGKAYKTVGEYCSDDFRFYYWLRHLCVAILLKDNAAIVRLCQITKEHFRNVPMGNNEYTDSIMDFLGAVLGDAEEGTSLRTTIMAALEKSGIEFKSQDVKDYALLILFPFVKLMILTVTNADEDEYREAWLDAVKSHKEYWNSCKRLRDEHDGWISFPITAVSSLMYDQKGFKLPKKSPYVPEWLVYGEFEQPPSVATDFYEGEIE
ncbi:immunity 49 family protein [Litoribacillus peritrichatus]|uniref:Uncharacterized protein n=1 Tax=Litoribacillus peritrichatus TaxID=718191 RepID=A0ABP7NB83_9GAMM